MLDDVMDTMLDDIIKTSESKPKVTRYHDFSMLKDLLLDLTDKYGYADVLPYIEAYQRGVSQALEANKATRSADGRFV